MKNELTPEQAHAVVNQYQDGKDDVTRELYSFGQMLLTESLDRARQLESKALAVAGYSGAMLAFFVARSQSWSAVVVPWQRGLLILIALLACAAVSMAGLATLIRRYPWFSDRQWLKSEGNLLENADLLRRYHVLAMHSINRQHGQALSRKAQLVFMAQGSLFAAALLLSAVMLGYAVRVH